MQDDYKDPVIGKMEISPVVLGALKNLTPDTGLDMTPDREGEEIIFEETSPPPQQGESKPTQPENAQKEVRPDPNEEVIEHDIQERRIIEAVKAGANTTTSGTRDAQQALNTRLAKIAEQKAENDFKMRIALLSFDQMQRTVLNRVNDAIDKAKDIRDNALIKYKKTLEEQALLKQWKAEYLNGDKSAIDKMRAHFIQNPPNKTHAPNVDKLPVELILQITDNEIIYNEEEALPKLANLATDADELVEQGQDIKTSAENAKTDDDLLKATKETTEYEGSIDQLGEQANSVDTPEETIELDTARFEQSQETQVSMDFDSLSF